MGNSFPPCSPQQAALIGLDTELENLKTQILSLIARRDISLQAKTQILRLGFVFNASSSTSSNVSQATSSGTYLAAPGPSTAFVPRSTLNIPLGQPSSLTASFKKPSSLRRKLLIRQAEERDESPPTSSDGLLPSADFEAAFEDGDVWTSVENQGLKMSPESPSPISSSRRENSKASEATKQSEAWKEARKRKWQENAAKAREARRRRPVGLWKDQV